MDIVLHVDFDIRNWQRLSITPQTEGFYFWTMDPLVWIVVKIQFYRLHSLRFFEVNGKVQVFFVEPHPSFFMRIFFTLNTITEGNRTKGFITIVG